MKYIYLIAWREYSENARTKGFWLGLLLVPFIIFLSIQVPVWLQKKGTPTRYYVLADQSGSLAPSIKSRCSPTSVSTPASIWPARTPHNCRHSINSSVMEARRFTWKKYSRT